MGFQAPIAEIAFTMRNVAGIDAVLASGKFGDVTFETIETVLAEAGRFASDVLAPLNRIGDRMGVKRTNGKVETAPGWREAYRRFAADGWNGISAPAEWGGQALPVMVDIAVQEMWNSASAAFAGGPMLTGGAIEALALHGSDALKQRYLPKLVTGEWMGTMNLTEPQAGSDLGALRTRAERQSDGTYRIFGQKIFITYGDHDLTDNIIHFVLARLADAPTGTAGISLFLVPKVIDGKPNDVAVAGTEHKLGLHGSPTCTINYGERGEGAIGFLVGEENRGLACMFTMMNLARLTVGIQGVGVAEGAYQDALAYARERRQGHLAGTKGGPMIPIIDHPDVQRMLIAMKALVVASRTLCYACAQAIDLSRHGPQSDRQRFADRASLLTPIAKAFSTDSGIEVSSLGIQVHGGAGYIEETGVAQHLRDARVFAIYEGTNGIQAIDLATRKLKLANGGAVKALLDEITQIARDAERRNHPDLGGAGTCLSSALIDLRTATAFMRAADHSAVLSGATPYLRLFALTLGGAFLVKGALNVRNAEDAAWVALARYFAETMMGETSALVSAVTAGPAALRQAATTLFFEPVGTAS